MDMQKTKDRQHNFEKEERSYRTYTVFFIFNTYYRAIIIKVVWYWCKNRHTDWWKRTENPEEDPHAYGQLIFQEKCKNN